MTTGFIILVVLILLAIWIYLKVAAIPGKIARERSHPQAEAINVLGWVGLLLGVVPWLVALIWAYTKPITILTITATGSPDPQPVPVDTKTGVSE